MHPASCPNSTETGCRCPEHAPGLREYARDPVAYSAALARLRPAQLHVVTLPPSRGPKCTGTMTCGCKACVAERASIRPQAERRQPWDPKPSSRAAA